MSLFSFNKNKEEKKSGCCCGGNCKPQNELETKASKGDGASIKVLGSGCSKCNQLEAATVEALKELGITSPVEHVTDFAEIASYGVMRTPALLVNGKVVSFGKVLKKDEAAKLIQEALL